MSFESAFCMKIVKSRLFKKYLKKRKSRARFCLFQLEKIIEHCNSVDAGAHKVRKVVSLWPNFDPNFPDIWKVQKRVNYIY